MADKKTGDDRAGGYFISALIFAAVTAAWAYIVRQDDFYQWTQLLGLRLPFATVFYLIVMPLAGFWAGRWRYQSNGRNNGSRGLVHWLAKIFARILHFFYSHVLIALFTVAMMTEYFLGWNISQSVREIDDSMFDVAERFAPWLSAYLAGFNLGRAWGISFTSNNRAAGRAAGRVAGKSSRPSFGFRSSRRGGRDPDDAPVATDGSASEERWPDQEEIVFADNAKRRKFFSRLR